MKIEAIISLAVPLTYFALLFIESRFMARPYESMRYWRKLGALFFIVTIVAGSITPYLVPISYLKAHSLLDLSSMGMWGIPVGLLAGTFAGYWLHRAEHRFNWLWRATHQLHHSPQRVDMWGAFYTHPVGVMVRVVIGIVVSTFILGLAPVAASVVSVVITALALFQHTNIHTSRVLGYFVQRPESHGLHHERERHTRNFSDLPLWDIVFGTFVNPATFNGKVGFDDVASNRVCAMLLMQDAHKGLQ